MNASLSNSKNIIEKYAVAKELDEKNETSSLQHWFFSSVQNEAFGMLYFYQRLLMPDTLVSEMNTGSPRFSGIEYYQQAQGKIVISAHLQTS